MKLLQAIFEDEMNGICLAAFGGPGLQAVRQSLLPQGIIAIND
jgi:hypothetical protein